MTETETDGEPGGIRSEERELEEEERRERKEVALVDEMEEERVGLTVEEERALEVEGGGEAGVDWRWVVVMKW